MTIIIGLNIGEVCNLTVKAILGVVTYASVSKILGVWLRHLSHTFSEIRKEVDD